ncbi:DUF5123 domain-containing protein [Reichenbachiella ulvae]|uniref:DUF5123 domain-containing protein n=1 Tax=Reichenbachiella ulvae TaxID=2980104 RepID=A0ABT3CZ21_9BACT|nr:DUF5123 domain-containing protein [Reichenbachiella ulvae]MCV9388829.1 DUF5123 domain-containing protein [Reichenbachiella ulvae]
MKNLNFNIKTWVLLLLVAAVSVFYSCQEDESSFPRTRLFQPVLNEALFSEGNSIIVNLAKFKEAESYILEVSRDTFQTIDYTFEVDTNYVVIDEAIPEVGEELLWFTIYQVRAQAIADDVEYNSKVSELGNVRTQKYPSNQMAPGQFDVTDTRAKVIWQPVGNAITTVVIYDIDDNRLETPLAEYTVSAEDNAAGEIIIDGLDPETEYNIATYSGDVLRGWEAYTTYASLIFPAGTDVIDLVGIDNPDILSDTLPDISNGAVVILEGGRTYNANGHAFNKSVKIMRGLSFVPSLPIIDCGSNYNIEDGASIDSLVFNGIHLTGGPSGFGGKYAFNIDKSGNIGEIKFEECEMRLLRGITRIKGGTGMIDNYSIVESVADSINGYSVFAVDTDGWQAGDILLENSTFNKCQYFLISRSNTNSLTIESCTINAAPEGGRQLFRWRGADGSNDILNGVSINNTILGPGWDMSGLGTNTAIKGYQGLANTNINVVNSYIPSDLTFASDEISGFNVYGKTAAELWVDPENNDFNIADTGFPGASSAGDPRWRTGL